MVRCNNCDLWIAWMTLFCMEGFWLDDRHTGKVSGGASALEVTVTQSSVQVARGQAAILPCSFSTNAALTNLNVIWMVIPLSNANQPEQVIIYQGGQVFSLANQLSGRVGFVSTMPHPSSASIVINNTQLSDTGTYQCLVNNLPDRGGRNIGVIGLTVLVPPSAPVCAIQGSLDVGSDVVLMCGSEEGIPTPSYSWEKMDALPGRLPPNAMQDHQQGSVSLRNISSSVSGLYQCTSTNVVGKNTCTLNVQVVAPQPQRVGLIAGTVASSILALVVISLMVTVSLFYWRNRNKYDEEEIPNEIREDDLPPKRSSSSVKSSAFHGGGGGDASSSENDTLTSTNTYNSNTRYWHRPSPENHAHKKTSLTPPPPPVRSCYDDAHSYTRYNGDTTQRTFSHGHNASQRSPTTTLVTPGSAPLTRHSHHHHHHQAPGAAVTTANGSHTLPPPPPAKTLVVTTNSAPPPCPPTVPARGGASSSNGTAGVVKPPAGISPGGGKHHHHHHHHHTSYAVSQATLERMGAVPVMVPAQSRAGSLV